MSARAPSIFICYRRADEPFAAALTASILEDAVGADEVFLDTLYLRQRGSVERALLEAVRNCRIVLAVIGAHWDSPANLDRLARPKDRVRRELLEAAEGGTPIVPVLVGRDTLPSVAGLDLKFDQRCLTIDPNDPDHLQGDLRRLLEITGSAGRGGNERVVRAVLALLRHVLPRPQRSMSNDLTVARCVASELDRGDWLRFVTTGNLPDKTERLGRRLRDPQRGRGRTAHREPPQPPRDPVAVDRPRRPPCGPPPPLASGDRPRVEVG